MTSGRIPYSSGIPGFNRRRFERYPCSLRMTYSVLSSRQITPYEYGVAQAKDLSESGVCVLSEHPASVPLLLQLNINLPMRPFHMLVLGKAVRCEEVQSADKAPLYEIGIRFIGVLPPEFKRLVAEVAPPESSPGDDDTPGPEEDLNEPGTATPVEEPVEGPPEKSRKKKS